MNPTTSSNQYDSSGGGVSSDATSSANMTTNVVTTESSVVQTSTTTLAPIPKMNYLSPTLGHSASTKRVIRKITPIDPKKLQQLGFNREIAAAISKQKKSSQLAAASSSKPTQMVSKINQHTATATASSITGSCSSGTIVTSSKTILASPVVTTQQHLQPPTIVKASVTPKTIIPPKITITGPEAPTEMELKKLEVLNSQQRLIHVKNLLNKKLLQKKTTTNDANVKLYKRLKPPTETTALQVQNNVQLHHKELLTVADKVLTQSECFIKLKDTEDVTPAKVIKLPKTKTPLKTPKDIARKIDFQSETEMKTIQQPQQRSYKKSLNSEICTIPKASLQNSNIQDQQIKQTNYVSVNKEAEHYEKTKIDFPEMSPLKIHFPSANVPQETPLPAIDSFKKPYTLSNAAFYSAHNNQNEFIPSNYCNPAILPQSSLIGTDFNTQFPAASSTGFSNSSASNNTNCLIVLENKVLSQDEMIDLTELRLSTSKVGTPRFATPHKPIPEVVIKQEKSDEYSTNSPPLPREESTQQTNIAKESKVINNKPSTNTVVISTKQNKKIIINAHKLKLPPGQLADLAKQIAQRTGVAKPNSVQTIQQNKQHSITSFDSKGCNNTSLINTSHTQNYGHFIVNPIDNANTSYVNSLASNNNIQLNIDPYQNDHNYLSLPKQSSNKRIVTSTPIVCNRKPEVVEKSSPKEVKENEIELGARENNLNQFIVIVKEEPKSNDGFSNTANSFEQSTFVNTNTTTSIDKQAKSNRSSVCYRKPAVEIVDEPVQMEDCFSAVDFIATLNETNPITEETSLELSPEELNLNASFAMNLSPLRIDTQRTSKRQLSPAPMAKDTLSSSTSIGNIINMPENSITTLSPQQLSTIVIESSNGPETILTSDNDDIIMDNTVQNAESVSNGNNMQLEIEKTKNLAQYSVKVQKHIEFLDKPMNPEETSNNISEHNQISLDTLPSKNLKSLISNELPIEPKATSTVSETSSVEKTNTQVELREDINETSLREPSNILLPYSEDLKDLPRATDINKSLITSSNEHEKQTLQKPQGEIALELGKIESTSITTLSSIVSEETLEKTKTIEDEIVASSAQTNKGHQEIEISKTKEITSAGTIPVKRISRFKKGKINLVQRNKAGASTSKTIGPKANEQKLIKESQVTSTGESLSKMSPSIESKDKSIEASNESNKIINELSKTESKNEVNDNSNQSNLPLNANESKGDNAVFDSEENPIQLPENERIIDVNFEKQIHQVIKPNDIPDSLPIETSKPLESTENSATKEPEQESIVQIAECQTKTNNETEETAFIKPNITSAKNADKEISKNLVENVRQPKVSLIDIVKHVPQMLQGKPPVIPFNKNSPGTCQRTQEGQYKGIQNLLQQLKPKENYSQKEKQESFKETNQHVMKSPMPLQQELCATQETSSIHECDNVRESLTEARKTSNESILNTTSTTDDKHSTKQLNNDEDLEFLPVNAEIEQFKPAKSCENINTPSREEKEKTKSLPATPLIKTRSAAYLGITPLSNASTRRTRLYSKPLDIELSPTVKRTRFYSQSHTQFAEINNTLKPLLAVTKQNTLMDVNSKSLVNEESCQFSSSHDEKRTSPRKQRKKLRKTLEDIKKSQNSYGTTDSEDDDIHNFESTNDCEETNEFLGFEEDTSNSFKIAHNVPSKHNVENISLTKPKGGTLKNWLTTGKAISPTLNEAHKDPTSSPIKRPGGPLKKRLDFSASLNDETDITDDTSPADDEEECKNIFRGKRPRRGIQNVIDSDKNLLGSKRIKLVDKPSDKIIESNRIIESKTLCSEADCTNEKVNERIHTRLLGDTPHDIEVNRMKQLSPSIKASQSETDSDCHKERTSRRLKSKDKAKNNKITTDSDIEIQSGRESDVNEGSTSKRLKSKEILSKKSSAEIVLKGNTSDSKDSNPLTISSNSRESVKADNGNCRGYNFENKEALDKSTKSAKSDHENNSIKSKRSKKCKTKQHDTENMKNEEPSLDILQTHETKSQEILNANSGSTTAASNDLNKISRSESIDNKDNAAQMSSPCLDKKLKKKKKNLNETHATTPASKKAKRSRVQSESPKEDVVSNKPTSSLILKKNENSVIAQSTPQLKSKKAKLSKDQNEPPKRSIATASPLEENSNDTATTSLAKQLNAEQPSLNKKSRTQSKRKLPVVDSDSDDNTEKNIKAPVLKENIEANQKETPKAATRGKKRNPACNFNPRLLLITKREQYDTDEILTVSQPGNGAAQCGLCLERMHPSKWTLHLAQHYGIGWKVGEEKKNILSRSAILNGMNVYIKETAPEGLNCRMCNKTYRSGAGLLMHIESCGMQQIRLTCEYCKRDYAQSSLPIHLRSCRVRFKVEYDKNQTKDEGAERSEEVFGNTGRLKRHSTIKAENKLKVIEKELFKELDDKKKSEFEPKDRIRYVPPLVGSDFKTKWSAEIKKCGKGSCPKKLCKFTSANLKELTNHLSSCKYIKSGYVCRPCRKRIFKTEKEAIEHVIKTHQNANESDYEAKTDLEASSEEYDNSIDGSDISADEALRENEDIEDDEENTEKSQKTRKNRKPYNRTVNPANATTFQRKRVFNGRYMDLNGEILKEWKDFLKLSYATETLFAEFNTDFSVRDHNNCLKYLPSNVKSMKFNIAMKASLKPTLGEPESNIEWSELNRFESINNKMDTFFYLGAPIKFCCWLPLPNNVEEQYLLVSYRRDKYTKFLNPKQHKTILLIFKVVQNNRIAKLKIHYGFIVNDGPVHNVAFLPSGGYDASKNRLGLVAVATIKSSIKIYALPISVENANTTAIDNDICDSNIVFIDIKPSFSLSLDMQRNEQTDQHTLINTQCLKICWSEFSGHKHIFASFSNGFIGIWDITNDSEDNLNRYVVEDFISFVPINYFYLGEKGVKSIALHYDTNGPRWLAVAGLSRKFVIYDIKYLTQPIVMKDDCAKNIILSMDWCQLWETVLYGYCDSMPNNGRFVVAVNPTNVMFTTNKLDLMASGVTQVHYSPVTNMCAAAGDNGDLIFLNPRELHYEYPLGKQCYERRVLCAMDIKRLNGEPLAELPKGNTKNLDKKIICNWKMHEEKENYGLIFKPFLKLKDSLKKIYLNEKRCPSLNIVPFLRINALRYNLNLNAKNLVAVGYENGFLRIVYFNRDTQMDN